MSSIGAKKVPRWTTRKHPTMIHFMIQRRRDGACSHGTNNRKSQYTVREGVVLHPSLLYAVKTPVASIVAFIYDYKICIIHEYQTHLCF